MTKYFVLLAGLLLLAGCAHPPSSLRVSGVPNFHRVSDRLYRGAQPDAAGIQALAGLGVKTIINLRMADDVSPQEESAARAHGVGYLPVPLHGWRSPTDAEIAQVLSLIETSPPPVFVHCRRGADRTGTIIACYRIQHDGWTADAARQEAEQHGMAWAQFAMKKFIADFGAASTRK